MRETMWLEEGDGIFVVRHRLEQAQARQIALVVPPGNATLRTEANLALVRRFADALALDLVLVTNDPAVKRGARAVGLRITPTPGGAQRIRHRRQEALFSRLSGIVPASAPALAAAAARAARQRMPRLSRRAQQIGVLAAGLGVTLLVLMIVMIAVPTAEVSLDPKGERKSAQAEVLASTELLKVDYEERQVPARQVSIEVIGEEDGQTTGKISSVDQHATGEVVFANRTTEPLTVTKGTVVRTSDGEPVKFYTLLDVGVPGSYGATARAPIMAFEPGPVGNVEALTIRAVEGEAGYKVEVLNDKATRGGTEKRVSIVAAQDHDRLRASLMERLQREAYDLLVKQLDSGEWIPPDSLEVVISEETFDRKVDEPAEALRLTMKVKVTGLAVQGQATRALMSRLLEEEALGDASQGKSGLVVNDATLQVEQPVGSASISGQTVRFRADANALLVPEIDLRTISKELAGQDRRRALSWLAKQYDLRQEPQIRVEPHWWPRLPWLPSRIQVHLGGGL